MFRMTPQSQLARWQHTLQQQSLRTQQQQQQLSSGVRVARPADDPGAMREILMWERGLAAIRSERETMQMERARGAQIESTLLEIQQLTVAVRDLALNGRQEHDPALREVLAKQVQSIRQQLEQHSQQSYLGRELFPASRGNRIADSSGAGRIDREDLFHPATPAAHVLEGETGLKLGTGSAVGGGRAEIRLTHLETSYSGSSGVQPGTNSPGGDTVLGPWGLHHLQVQDLSGTGAWGTISLNGGPPVTFTSTDNNLQVVGSRGEQVFVNTTTIAPGYSGTIELQGAGQIQLGQSPPQAVTFTGTQQLADDSVGQLLYLDTSEVFRTGLTIAEPRQGTDLFLTLQLLEDDLRYAGDPQIRDQRLSHRLENLQLTQDQLAVQIGRSAARSQAIEQRMEQLDELELLGQQRLAELRDADLAEVVMSLRQTQQQTELSLAALARWMNTSILDFLG